MATRDEKRILICASYIRARSAEIACQQRATVRSFIERRFGEGWIPSFPSYEDIGHSGFARSPGPALARLMNDADAREFDIVVVARPNRISRRVWLLYDIVERLDASGVTIYSAIQDAPLLDLVPREQLRRTAEFFRELDAPSVRS